MGLKVRDALHLDHSRYSHLPRVRGRSKHTRSVIQHAEGVIGCWFCRLKMEEEKPQMDTDGHRWWGGPLRSGWMANGDCLTSLRGRGKHKISFKAAGDRQVAPTFDCFCAGAACKRWNVEN